MATDCELGSHFIYVVVVHRKEVYTFGMPKTPWEKLGFPIPKSEASRGTLSLADYEVYSGIELPEGPFAVRLDGWAFHSLTRKLELKKPFDKNLASSLAKTAKAFFVTFNPSFAYVFSDEINLIFTKKTAFKRIEKIDSVFAGFASTTFKNLIKTKQDLAFDCRCIPLPEQEILSYLIWRQAECFRNHNNSWAQHMLMKKKKYNARKCAKELGGKKTAELRKVSKKFGKDLDKTPMWQRDGIIIRWKHYTKTGYNPIEKKKVRVERRRSIIDWTPPLFKTKKGKKYLEELLKNG